MPPIDEIIAYIRRHREALLQNPESLERLTKLINELNASVIRRELMNRRKAGAPTEA